MIELKYNKDADSAIDQIMRKQYPAKVMEYTDNLFLVGINYDKETKTHSCKIENLVNWILKIEYWEIDIPDIKKTN